jgi:hypothetical protein
MNQMHVRAGIRFLEQAGLNLVAVLDCAALPEATGRIMRESGVPLSVYRRLVLLGHGGKRMWQARQKRGVKTIPWPITAQPWCGSSSPATWAIRLSCGSIQTWAISCPCSSWANWPAGDLERNDDADGKISWSTAVVNN